MPSIDTAVVSTVDIFVAKLPADPPSAPIFIEPLVLVELPELAFSPIAILLPPLLKPALEPKNAFLPIPISLLPTPFKDLPDCDPINMLSVTLLAVVPWKAFLPNITLSLKSPVPTSDVLPAQVPITVLPSISPAVVF